MWIKLKIAHAWQNTSECGSTSKWVIRIYEKSFTEDRAKCPQSFHFQATFLQYASQETMRSNAEILNLATIRGCMWIILRLFSCEIIITSFERISYLPLYCWSVCEYLLSIWSWELLTQFPASNGWKTILFIKYGHLPNWIIWSTEH